MKTINFKVPFKTQNEVDMEKIDTKLLKLINVFSGLVQSSYPEGENTVYVFTIQDYQRARLIRELRGMGLDFDDINTGVV